MGLAEKLSKPSEVHPNAGCAVGHLLQRLSDSEAEAVRGALADDRFTSTEITKHLQDDGYTVTSHTMGRHRRGDCRCDEAGLT